MLQLIFSEIRADHMDGKLVVTFKPLPYFEPYVAAVLAKRAVAESGSNPVSTSERKTGLEPAVAHRQITFRSGWLELEAA